MDREGKLIATTVTLHKVILSPIHIPSEHIDLVSSLIAKHLHLDADDTKEKILAKRQRKANISSLPKKSPHLAYQNLMRELREIYKSGDRAFRKSFRDVRARGISQTEETYRYYTGKSDAAPLLGGFSRYSHRGVGGLEQQYDSVLRRG